MRTTLDLPDDLLRRAKIAAVERGTTLRALVGLALERELGGAQPRQLGRRRTRFPIFKSKAPGTLDLILAGEPGSKRDIVLVNSAAALVAGARVRDLQQGVEVARHPIDSGAARARLDRLVELCAKEEQTLSRGSDTGLRARRTTGWGDSGGDSGWPRSNGFPGGSGHWWRVLRDRSTRRPLPLGSRMCPRANGSAIKQRLATAHAARDHIESWPEITRLARDGGKPRADQGERLKEQE